MCTVTYFPASTDTGIILTSSRDELRSRPTQPPQVYALNGGQALFPRDEVAGGTWIAANDRGRLCCLLNGAFLRHEKQGWHTLSRGQVLLGMISGIAAEAVFTQEVLRHTEPFTLLVWDGADQASPEFSEFIWDGDSLHTRHPDPGKPAIWSSATLYADAERVRRKVWYQTFLERAGDAVSADLLWSFHLDPGGKERGGGLRLDRPGGLQTVSLTQVVLVEGRWRMRYLDLMQDAGQVLEL